MAVLVTPRNHMHGKTLKLGALALRMVATWASKLSPRWMVQRVCALRRRRRPFLQRVRSRNYEHYPATCTASFPGSHSKSHSPVIRNVPDRLARIDATTGSLDLDMLVRDPPVGPWPAPSSSSVTRNRLIVTETGEKNRGTTSKVYIDRYIAHAFESTTTRDCPTGAGQGIDRECPQLEPPFIAAANECIIRIKLQKPVRTLRLCTIHGPELRDIILCGAFNNERVKGCDARDKGYDGTRARRD
ncbi:hypothetical protein EDC04DRAFT_2601800 [Pisolithus marmoratus]|nr:hypothetical protein EDC04DRAFT_2601800 [Pisolithus marmoratus]